MGDWYIGPSGRWVYDPNAPSPNREPTAMMPQVNSASLRDEEDELEALHGDDVQGAPEVPRAGDIGDWIDPNAPDPTPPQVTDPDDPNHVHPWFGDR